MANDVKRYQQYAPLTEATDALVRLYPGATQYVLAADHGRIVSSLTEAGRKLQAQVAALQSDANSYQSGYDKGRADGTKTRLSELEQERRINAELRAEVERLRKDAERYRWLDSRKRWPSVNVDFNRDGRYRQHRICWYSGDGWSDATGQTLTEAIDAAMEASHDRRTEDGNG